MTQLLTRVAIAGCLPLLAACELVGPSCLDRRETGPVTSVSGSVSRGEMVSSRIPYDPRGSQNDVRLSWTRQREPGGPRLRFYATAAGCTSLPLPPAITEGPCAILGSAGVVEGIPITELHVTHGRGNPERLGTPPEFLLWIVGDPDQDATFSADVTWLFGPDC